MTDTILDAAKRDLDRLPKEQAGVTVQATQSDIGLGIEGAKQLGQGWSVEGDATWWQKAGWKAAAWFGWTGGQK